MVSASSASANNGEIAYAISREGIVIDGDLSDWKGHELSFSIRRGVTEETLEATDFSASFRAAYSRTEGSLYLAVEVVDEHHTVDRSSDANWLSQDTHLLYIDRQHLVGGSGNTLYQAGEAFRGIIAPPKSWDPVNGGADWKDVEIRVVRDGLKTIYEWRIFLGEDLAPNKTLGLGHVLADKDNEDEEPSLISWGEGLGKSANSYRLGDLLLLGPEASLGELRGSIGWRGDVHEPLPSKVRITSLEHPELWLQASVAKDGHYSARLPVGEYSISSAFTLSKPFREDANNLPLRIDDSAKVRAIVRKEQVASAGLLKLPTYYPPEFLFHRQGILEDFEPGQSLWVDTFVETYRRYYDVPGVSVALIKGSKLAYHRTFGVRNSLTREPVETTTLFEAASITKPVFAFAILRLAERGLIDLDRPLDQYLPFPNIVDDERSKLLTARTVLTHQSGLPNWAWGGPGGWEEGGPIELAFEPGTRYGYSGEAFNYLGRVIEKVTGKDLAKVLREEVTEPLGLENAFFALDEDQAATASIGHYSHLPVLRPRAATVSPASSLHTDAKNFSDFLIGLALGTGLSQATYSEMLRPWVEIPPEKRDYDDGRTQSLGLGFFLRDSPRGLLVEHGGNNGDFDCKFGILPESGDGYVIFTNSNVGDELVRALELFLLVGRS